MFIKINFEMIIVKKIFWDGSINVIPFLETTDPAGWELSGDSPPQRPPEVSFLSRLRLEKPGKRNTHDRKTDVENIMRECLA